MNTSCESCGSRHMFVRRFPGGFFCVDVRRCVLNSNLAEYARKMRGLFGGS